MKTGEPVAAASQLHTVMKLLEGIVYGNNPNFSLRFTHSGEISPFATKKHIFEMCFAYTTALSSLICIISNSCVT